MADPTNEEILGSLKDEPAAPAEGGAEPVAAEPVAPSWNRQEWEFESGGRKHSPESRDQLMTWASQGRSFSQRQFEHNRAVQAWEQQKAQHEAKYKGFDKYAEVDNYARENKDWWEHVQQSFATRGQKPQGQPQGGADFSQVLAPIQSELQELRSWRDEQLQERQRQDLERADKALSDEIESIRGQHATIDFDAVDESGKTLEQRVLDHAHQINTSSFRAAFRDYYHDKLVESQKAAGLAAQAKAPDVAARKGILGTSQVPKKGPDAPVNLNGRSYDDINRRIAEDLGIAN